MSASSKARSSAPVLPLTAGFQRSMSPSAPFCSSTFSSPAATYSTAFATAQSGFSAGSSPNLFSRSTSPSRVNLIGSSPSASAVRFSLGRAISPRRPISAITARDPVIRRPVSSPSCRKTCMCSPTTHPGSFRCNLHRGGGGRFPSAVSSSSNRLNARRSAMTNSLVRIGTVEGDLVKRALAALIRPSSHQQRRRSDFQPRPSRLSRMSKADDI